MTIQVWDLLLDDLNVEEMHRHGVSPRRAFEILDEAPVLLRNFAKGGAPFLFVGPDAGGIFLSLPIDQAGEYGLWRPRTAYPSKARDVWRYWKKRKHR